MLMVIANAQWVMDLYVLQKYVWATASWAGTVNG